MQSIKIYENLKRLDLYRELNDKKQPQFGSFNKNYIQKLSEIKPIINKKFQENFKSETIFKFLLRKETSNLIRNEQL